MHEYSKGQEQSHCIVDDQQILNELWLMSRLGSRWGAIEFLEKE